MLCRKGFRISNIQGCTCDFTLIQGIAESIRINSGASSGVQNNGIGRKQCDALPVQDMISGRVAGKAHGDHIRPGKKVIQFFHSIEFIHSLRLVSHAALYSYGAAAQNFHFGGERGSYISQADYKDR